MPFLILDQLFLRDDFQPDSILSVDRVERRSEVVDVLRYLLDVIVEHVAFVKG